MIQKLTNYLILKGLQNSIISEEDVSVYRYGYTLMLEMAINIIIAIIIGLVLHSIIAVTIFLLVFMPLRSYSGGYHAASAMACTILSNMTIMVSVLLVKYGVLDSVATYVPVLEALIILLISLLSPVDSANKPLTKEEKKRCRLYVIGILLICYICQIILIYLGLIDLVLIIFTAMLADFISLLYTQINKSVSL